MYHHTIDLLRQYSDAYQYKVMWKIDNKNLLYQYWIDKDCQDKKKDFSRFKKL